MRTARIQMGGEPRADHRGGARQDRRGDRRGRPCRAISTRCSGSPPLGEASIASENFATLRHARLGDIIDMPSPSGVLRLPLVGVIREYSDQTGALFIDRDARSPSAGTTTRSTSFASISQPGAASAEVKEAILDEVLGQPPHLRALERRGAQLRHGAHRPVVRDDLGADRHCDPRGGARHRELAHGVGHAIAGASSAFCARSADLRSQVRWTIWMEAIGIGRRQRAARPRRSGRPSVLHAGDDLARLPGLALRLPVSRTASRRRCSP